MRKTTVIARVPKTKITGDRRFHKQATLTGFETRKHDGALRSGTQAQVRRR
jgi:hypothetical protein